MENMNIENQNNEHQEIVNPVVESQPIQQPKPKTKSPRQLSIAARKEIAKRVEAKPEHEIQNINSEIQNLESRVKEIREIITHCEAQANSEHTPKEIVNEYYKPKLRTLNKELQAVEKSIQDETQKVSEVEALSEDNAQEIPALLVEWFDGLTDEEKTLYFTVLPKMKASERNKLLKGGD